jgi:UDP-GlcNAc:undecaprenyl-phosphate GlcNAc-1-phosphate transferase
MVALAVALLLAPVCRWVALRTGLVDRPGGALRIHHRPVPVLGGVAVAVAAVAGAAVASSDVRGWAIAGVAVALLVGLADDVRPVPVWLRLLGQAAAGALLVAGGVRLEALAPLDEAATVVLAVLLANAVNIVDGQDGLAGGLAAVASVGLLGLTGWAVAEPAGALALGLVGALVAFLVWNLPPARIFLGNGGAYAVGTLMAVPAASVADGWVGLVAATVCLGVFAFELVFTVVRRARARAPLTAGDRGHSYDVVAGSVGRTASTIAFWGIGAAAAGIAMLLDAAAGTRG